MKLSRLSAEDFVRIAAKTKMGVDAQLMAKRVLVDQRALAEVASEHAVTKQRVHLAVETIREKYAIMREHCGWINAELEMPHTLALELERFAAALGTQLEPGARQVAVGKVAKALASAQHALK